MHLPTEPFVSFRPVCPGPWSGDAACSGSEKRRGQSTACWIPMRGVTSTSLTAKPSSRNCSGELGSSRSSPLWIRRVSPSAWQRRLGPEVSWRAARRAQRRDSWPFAQEPPVPHRFSARNTRIRPGPRVRRRRSCRNTVRRLHKHKHDPRGQRGLIARRGPAIGVGGGVGRNIVRPQIGLRFHDPAGKQTETSAVQEQFAQQPRGDLIRRRLKKGARKQGPVAAGDAGQPAPAPLRKERKEDWELGGLPASSLYL